MVDQQDDQDGFIAPLTEMTQDEKDLFGPPTQKATTGPKLTKDEICDLSRIERMKYVEHMRVLHPEFTKLYAKIWQVHHYNMVSVEPKCMFIEGSSGVGKTTLLKSYAARFPTLYEGENTIVTAAYGVFFQRPRIANAAATFLEAFGDPFYDKGDPVNMAKRIQGYKDDCKIEIFLGDELQDLFDRDKHKVMHEVTNWIKFMLKELKIAVVFTGLEKEAWEIIDSNKQLRRLFGRKKQFLPFEWDISRPEETKKLFIDFLKNYEESLPLKQQSGFTTEDLSFRLFAACRGRIGFLVPIVRKAAYLALQTGKECITQEMLSVAFDDDAPLDIDNPFVGNLPKYPFNDIGPDIKLDQRKPKP